MGPQISIWDAMQLVMYQTKKFKMAGIFSNFDSDSHCTLDPDSTLVFSPWIRIKSLTPAPLVLFIRQGDHKTPSATRKVHILEPYCKHHHQVATHQ